MFFEAILFLAGAVLFLLAVVFFIFLWQDRVTLFRRREALRAELMMMKEQRVDLDIREHELVVWAEGLENQQKAIEKAEEELRMLTAAKLVSGSEEIHDAAPVEMDAEMAPRSASKNVKPRAGSAKLHEKAL